MAIKLSKDELKRRDEIVEKLQTAAQDFQIAVDNYNEQVQALKAVVEAAYELYNEAVSEAHEFSAEIDCRLTDEIGEKSEKWQDGEKGQAAIAMQEEWMNASFDAEAELEWPDDLEFDDPDHASTLENLPTEPDA